MFRDISILVWVAMKRAAGALDRVKQKMNVAESSTDVRAE